MAKIEIEENTATQAFAALLAVNTGEDIEPDTEAALRDLGAALVPEIDMDQLIAVLKVGPK